MSDVRNILERGVGRFAPDPVEGLERIRKRTGRRRRNRRLVAAAVALAVFGGTVAGFWLSVRLGSGPAPVGTPTATPTVPFVVPTSTPSWAACDQGPWYEECPEAVWAEAVIDHMGFWDIEETDAALEVQLRDGGGTFLFWAMDPELHSGVRPLTEESLRAEGYEPFADVGSTRVYSDGSTWAWRVQGLNVWVQTAASPEPGRNDIERLVRATRSVVYDPDAQVCDFPAYRPTYLPWLQSGERVPEPERWRVAHGGGPQGLDPGYSHFGWGSGDITEPGGPKYEGGVSLWRSTESVGAIPPDPDVPPLPDGSEGRFYRGETSDAGDWAIIWVDSVPDPYDDPCSETTLSVYFPQLSKEEGKQEIAKIARSLVRED
jgi:hypothetical protein